jgi:hypothetical protein
MAKTEAKTPKVTPVAAPTNQAFFDAHGRAGCVGLVGGDLAIDRAIRKAQRPLTPDQSWAKFSHAFVFVGPREDGQLWVLESDLDFHRERVQLGVQENRVAKYADEKAYPHVAVLDFGLTPFQVNKVIALGLDLMARRTQYSLRELLAVAWSLKAPRRRQGANKLSQEKAMFCSAFVQHLYLAVGIDFALEVDTKLTLPEDIAQTTVPHQAWVRAARAA